MKSRIILVVLSLFFVTCLVSPASFAADNLPDLEDKTIYYTDDYISGDCILSSAKSMLRRAALARGSDEWDSITNTSLRDYATYYGTTFRNSFTYSNDGFTYEVENIELYGDGDEKQCVIDALVACHPEGVIVWGSDAADNGPHGVLVTGISNGSLYAVDSVWNSNGFNEGIQKWEDTTMKPIENCSNLWYLCSVNGETLVRNAEDAAADISSEIADDTEATISSALQNLVKKTVDE